MTNEEKANEIARCDCKKHYKGFDLCNTYKFHEKKYCGRKAAALEAMEWKDEQPIMESDGWHTEQPTEDGWYLVDTPDFPKNCCCVVAEWDNDAKSFYDEHSDLPIKFHRWKLIERG